MRTMVRDRYLAEYLEPMFPTGVACGEEDFVLPNPAKPEPYRIRSTHQTSAVGGTVEAAAERALPRAPRRGALVLRPDPSSARTAPHDWRETLSGSVSAMGVIVVAAVCVPRRSCRSSRRTGYGA
jgi:hypothetical protein